MLAQSPPIRHSRNRPSITTTHAAISFWLSRDPIGERGGLNLYGFNGNDGVNRWDYLGLKPKSELRLAVYGALSIDPNREFARSFRPNASGGAIYKANNFGTTMGKMFRDIIEY